MGKEMQRKQRVLAKAAHFRLKANSQKPPLAREQTTFRFLSMRKPRYSLSSDLYCNISSKPLRHGLIPKYKKR
jgi:hypothetical protein